MPKGENLVRLPYTSATATRESDQIIMSAQWLGEPGLEGPTVTPLKRHKRHRYIYGTGTFRKGFHENSVRKNLLCLLKTNIHESSKNY